MKNKFHLANILLLCLIFLAACNLPSGQAGEGLSLTAAAQTIQALTSATPGLPVPTATLIGGATATPLPTLPGITTTPVASPTTNCNVAQFVADVTIPDGTIMAPNQAFTKKWRLKNTGSCTWTGFNMTFDSGDAMGGPASKPIGTVNPGQEVDLEVNLTAPGTAGNYRGYWRIVTNTNVLVPVVNGYQGKSFYVDIKVQNPVTATSTLPPAIAQAVLTGQTGEDGYVTSDGNVFAFPNVGDTDGNQIAQAFVSFDMTAIPGGVTITKVVVDFSGYDTLGSPWALSDGCLRAYVHNYGTVDAADYFGGAPSGAVIRWCGAGELSSAFEDTDMKPVVQSAVGTSRLQLRLQFTSPSTNSNGVADMVRFGTVKLTVTYQ